MLRFWITAAASCLFFCSVGFAQSGIGVRVGINQAQQSVMVDSIRQGTVTGISAGLVGKIDFGDLISLQPELVFIQKGGELAFGDFVRSRTEVDYLELPLLIRLDIGGDKFGIFGLMGPSFGYAVEGTIKDLTTGTSDQIIWNDKPRFEVGGHLGGGMYIGLGIGQLTADIRMQYGFSDSELSSQIEVKNQGMGINFGYLVTF